jgi:hypothetical protein
MEMGEVIFTHFYFTLRKENFGSLWIGGWVGLKVVWTQ